VRFSLALLFVAACATPAPPPKAASLPVAPRNLFAEAQQAYAAGNVIDTAGLLRNVPESSPDYTKAKAQLAQVGAKADKLVAKLIARADDMVNDGLVQRAIPLLTDLLARVGGDKRADIEKKLQAARDKLVVVKQEYEDKIARGKDRLRGGDAREASRLLTRAADIADDNDLPWGFAEQQLLEQARIDAPAPTQRVSQHDSDPRRRHRRPVAETEMIVGSVDTFASQVQEIARLKNVRDLVDKARDFKKKGMLYEALVTLEEAHAKDPDSPAVKLGLEALEDDRSRLVDGYLEVADRYYAKQELEAAVPYFRRVLRLEPDNLRAKEAVQMFQNLEKIKQERTQSQ
jgi:tetratricopeptide (TPR) repeat protein